MENLNKKIHDQIWSQLESKLEIRSLYDKQLRGEFEIDWQLCYQLAEQLQRGLSDQLDWYLYWQINERLIAQMEDEKSQ
jgi:hypothetical protein